MCERCQTEKIIQINKRKDMENAKRGRILEGVTMCVCVCVCVRELECVYIRERKSERVCVCVIENMQGSE